MDSTDNHPFVAASPLRVEAIERRAHVLLRHRAEDRFRELVREWAAADEGGFPTRARAEREARDELEVLCRGLGRWAALTPDEVFPRGLTPIERLLVQDEEWPP